MLLAYYPLLLANVFVQKLYETTDIPREHVLIHVPVVYPLLLNIQLL